MTLQIDIGGKKYGIKFTMFSDEIIRKKSPFANLKKYSFTRFTYIVTWAGICGYLDSKEEEPDLTYTDVQEWIDKQITENKNEDIEKIWAAYEESDAFRELLKENESKIRSFSPIPEEEDNSKKKVASSLDSFQTTNLQLVT